MTKSVFNVGDRIIYHGEGKPQFNNPRLVGKQGVIIEDQGFDAYVKDQRYKIKWDESGRTSQYGVCSSNIRFCVKEYSIDQEPMDDEETL